MSVLYFGDGATDTDEAKYLTAPDATRKSFRIKKNKRIWVGGS